MLLGFKTEINPNKTQLTLLAQNAGVARHAWNWGLALTKQILNHNKINPDEKIKFPSAIDLHKWLVAIVKRDNPWYYESSKCSPQYALRALSDSWQRCSKKVPEREYLFNSILECQCFIKDWFVVQSFPKNKL